MKMLRKLLALAFIGASIPALAQPVFTVPSSRSTTTASSTISVTNTFQSVFAAATGRTGCVVQNTGTNSMYVFFGPIASATIAGSIKLSAGQSVNCATGGIVITDQVSITGTATETFYAASQ